MKKAGLHVTLGEAMVVLYPQSHLSLADAKEFSSDVGGAEFNVATTLSRLGVPTAWVSRLGADGLGQRIAAVAESANVNISAVEFDTGRQTGLYLKETTQSTAGPRTRMHYYRRGSAAAEFTPAFLASPHVLAMLNSAELIHTSGITAALSPGSAEAMKNLREIVGHSTRISVDLNFRPQLWSDRDLTALDTLVTHADLLFVGRDEAQTYFGHADPARLFEDNPRLTSLVVKDDALRASVYSRNGDVTTAPCLTVEVLEPVGAGDAFAAGFLCALAEDRDPVGCLRIGHAVAALTLVSDGDRPTEVVDTGERDRIARASEAEWASWEVSAGEIPWRLATMS